MRTREFLTKLEHDRIVQAIREAEMKTSGEIRVFIQRGKLNGDPLVAAQKKFQRLQMHKTHDRNAVLIFVAPRAHKFAVVGDRAIRERCGDELWQRIVERMRTHFQNEKFSHALVDGVEEIGKLLATHFGADRALAPRESDKRILPAFILWFFLGGLGAHRFYIGRPLSGVILSIVTIGGVIFTLSGTGDRSFFGGLSLLIGGVWLVVDLIYIVTGSMADGDGRKIQKWA
jgi:uncharacterized membrane protein YgcG